MHHGHYPEYDNGYQQVPQGPSHYGYGHHPGHHPAAAEYAEAAYQDYQQTHDGRYGHAPPHYGHQQHGYTPPPFSEDYYQEDYGDRYAEEDPYGGQYDQGPGYPPPDYGHGGHGYPPEHQQGRGHGQYSGGPPGYSSGSRRGPPPRPPPTDDHHKLHVRQRVPRGDDEELEQDVEEAAEDLEDDDGGADPMGVRQMARGSRRGAGKGGGRGQGQSQAAAGGGGDSDDSDGPRHVDPSLTVQRLGRIRQAQQSKQGGDQGQVRGAAAGPPGSSGIHVQDVARPPQAAQWQCGKARTKLRQQFNGKEIDVTKVMGQYDTNEDCKLEEDEFLCLLQDYEHWSQHITQQEVEMVLALADLDGDDCIEPNEVLYALRVWFAYVNMPRSVGPVLASLSDGVLPSLETIKEALLVLNEEQPVSPEEADYVRHLALALGGTEQRVTAKQMRMSISAWYLHIERKETARKELAKQAVTGAHAKICENNPIQKFCRGQCDPMTLASLGMFFVVWVLIPVIAIWVGEGADTGGYPCERPMLSQAVKFTGWLALFQAVAGLILTGAWECKALTMFRMSSGICFAIVTVALLIVWLMGFWQIMTTNPSRCGFVVWEFGNVIWIFVPILSLCFVCCGLPCIYCHEYCHRKQIDNNLMQQGKDSGEE